MTISRLWNAAAAVTGVLFVIVIVFGVIASLSPYAEIEPLSSSADIAAALTDGAANLATGNFVLLIAAFLLVVFSGYLKHALSPEGVSEWPTTVGFGGGILTAALLGVVALIGISQGQVDDYGVDTAAAKALLLLSWGSVSVTIPGLAALIGGMSLAGMSHESLPRWLGWSGAVTTVAVLTFWALGFVIALAWLSAVSVILVIREIRSDEIDDRTADEPAEG